MSTIDWGCMGWDRGWGDENLAWDGVGVDFSEFLRFKIDHL